MLFALLCWLGTAAAMSADEVLAAIDQNMTFESRTTTVTMTVTKGSRQKVYSMNSFGRGEDEAAIEFTAPARDKGTKMLKKGDELWMYMPSIEKTQKISGHMLRQGLMGSDLSYEDMMEAGRLRDNYTAALVGEETLDGRACYKLQLTAKDDSISYPKRTVWVDKEYLTPFKQELYAVSGMLMKEWTMDEVKDFDGRKYPTRITAADKLQAGSLTVIRFDQMAFKVPLEDETFTLRWLER